MIIIKSNLIPFLLQVGIPFVIAIGATLAVGAGYINLKNQINTQNDLADKAEKINQAFVKIQIQEDVLLSQKSELNKQQEITTSLQLEYVNQKKFNQLLNQIQIFSLGSKNGSRKDFEDFYTLPEKEKLNSELHGIWEKEYNYLRMLWESELEKVNFYRLIYNTYTGETRKWSKEYLYLGISSLWTNRSWAYNNKDYAAYFREIEASSSKYFIGTLYKIATEGSNIYISILAAKTLCTITNFEPYPSHQFTNSYNQLLNDIPKFNQMIDWWAKVGSENEEYKCPFEKIVERDRNYYSYDRDSVVNNTERLNFLNEATRIYPNLYRAKAELAYLKLADPSSYTEVERLAHESIVGTDMEPLSYLLLALIGMKQNDNNKMVNNFELAKQSLNKEAMLVTIQINPKLHALLSVLEQAKVQD